MKANSLDRLSFWTGRLLRDVRDYCSYPIWTISGCKAPDNHIFKRARISRILREFECSTFIETGTFYGQMVNHARHHVGRVLSCELSPDLFRLNECLFSSDKAVKIFFGDSASVLENMIHQGEGRILYWLDGHFSGGNTALGTTVTPILKELEIIKQCGRKGDCILIDDARLFGTEAGYPSSDEIEDRLCEIDQNYRVRRDCDCIVALPT